MKLRCYLPSRPFPFGLLLSSFDTAWACETSAANERANIRVDQLKLCDIVFVVIDNIAFGLNSQGSVTEVKRYIASTARKSAVIVGMFIQFVRKRRFQLFKQPPSHSYVKIT